MATVSGGIPAGTAHADGRVAGVMAGGARDQTAGHTGTFLAVLVGSAPVIPAIAALCTAMAYSTRITWWPIDLSLFKPYPVLEGTLLVAAIWLVYAAGSWLSGHADADSANVRDYSLIHARSRRVAAQLTAIAAAHPELANEAGAGHARERIAYHEARALSEDVERERRRRGPNWVMATGYVNLWTLVHGAEQALIELKPKEEVVRDALYDQLRLKGSTVDERDDWLLKLRAALKVLSPTCQQYLDPAPCCYAAVNAAPHPTATAAAEAEAVGVIRSVRRAIDEFRDDRRDKLVRACNRLKATVFVTGLAVYALMVAEIGLGVGRQQIHSVVVLALCGVMAGFFGRLNADAGANSAGEDYGLSATRLRLIPVFSGLAAIGGIVAGETLRATGLANLDDVFTVNLPHLITAAIFGLAPGLLIDRLQQNTTEQYKRDLTSTQANATAG